MRKLYARCYLQTYAFNDTGHERIAHKKGSSYIRCSKSMIVREHVQTFKLYRCQSAIFTVMCLDDMLES